MALPLIYLAGAGVALLWARNKKLKDQQGGDPLFDPTTRNPLVAPSATGRTRGGLDINSQLQRARFGPQGSSPVTPPPSQLGLGPLGGKPPGFR